MPLSSNLRTLTDVPCTACGCLCDDIVLTVDENCIVAADHACPIGSAWFLGDHSVADRPRGVIEGAACSAEEAMARASEILSRSRSPLILGLTRTSLEAQAAAVSLADFLGATIDPASSRDSLPRWRAVQRVGVVSATLGEVRNRADLVVFWGVDPVTTHPRHLERYSVGPKGRFVPEGRAGRIVVVVDEAPTPTSAVADRFVRIVRQEQGEVLATLRALVRGVEIPDVDDPLKELADDMTSARYGAFFFGPGLGPAAVVEEALKLVRDLNARTRFVALTLGSAGNGSGAEAVLSWQAGAPVGVDFSEGFPRFRPDTSTAELMLESGWADAAIVVADDPGAFLSAEALARLAQIPTVVIGPRATDPGMGATAGILTATYGIHAGGTVIRCDGATLPLRPSLATTLPSDGDVLAAIEANMKAITS